MTVYSSCNYFINGRIHFQQNDRLTRAYPLHRRDNGTPNWIEISNQVFGHPHYRDRCRQRWNRMNPRLGENQHNPPTEQRVYGPAGDAPEPPSATAASERVASMTDSESEEVEPYLGNGFGRSIDLDNGDSVREILYIVLSATVLN